MSTTETNRYLVPHVNLDALRAKIAKLSRKAAKLGVVSPDIVIGEHVASMRDKINACYIHRLFEVTVSGSVPRVETGHEFVAKLHHVGPAATLVMQAEGAAPMPVHYRTRGAYCDHCKTMRPRHDTFVLRAEHGEYVQVGRSCLADFMPARDAAAIVALSDWLNEANEVCGEESDPDREPRGDGDTSLVLYLAAVVRVVEVDGFFMSASMARKMCDEHRPLTSGKAMTLVAAMFNRGQTWAEDMIRDYGKDWMRGDSTQAVKANAAIAWAAALTDDECVSEYMANIRTLANVGSVDRAGVGLAASIPTAYARAKNALAERNAAPTKAHVGTVGKRETFTFLVERVVPIESDYGISYLHIFRDAAGNVAKWKASSGAIAGQMGDTVTITGTVKEHGEYKGVPQTVLTRCKVLAQQAAA